MTEHASELISPFVFTPDQRRWAARAQRKHGRTKAYWLDLIARQKGQCAFSGVTLRFDTTSGTAERAGRGVHPLYAAVDHCSPGCDDRHQLVSYDLNDLKGHLPENCFEALRETHAWKDLMEHWRSQAATDADNRDAFRSIRRPGAVFRRLP